jgi:flagellin
LLLGLFNVTSILTNTSATSALQTLRTVNNQLDTAQQQVSSGLRIQTASDNVAYWSISTTMRSDNKANSAVNDAIGIGSAKIDVAVAAIDTTIDIVSDFRAKLVTATETSIDRSKVQSELDALKDQLVATATSASFSGVNWLNTKSDDNLAVLSSLPDYVVSGFIRSPDGTVQVDKTEIDTADVSVFNVGGGGSLQKDIRSLGGIGGFRNADPAGQNRNGYQQWEMTGPVTLAAGESISFDISIDGTAATNLSIDKATVDAALGTTDGIISDDDDYATVIRKALADAGLSSRVSTYGSSYSSSLFSIVSTEQSGNSGSSIQVTNVTRSPAATAGGFEDTPYQDAPGSYAQTSFAFTGPFQIYRDVDFTFDLNLPNTEEQEFVVTRDIVDAALGTADGMVNSAADLASILNLAKNIDGGTLSTSGVIVSSSGGSVVFTIDSSLYPDKGNRSWFSIDNVEDNVRGPNFDILDVDITDPANDLDNYINGLDMMLERVIKSGATLGAAENRIDIQAQFNATLMDNIEQGVGRLVVADMEEASAILSAKQTQQQLAVQSLQIANSAPETIMQLFN